jgi:hypothetical protein
MAGVVARCDGYVVYFTPSSLYEGKDGPRPVIDEEFLPIIDRLGSSSPPVVAALVHGLGEPRAEATERVRLATGRDIGSLWMPITLAQGTDHITQPEAASIAAAVVRAVVASRAERLEPLVLSVVTRGSGQVPAVLTIDATSALGGDTPRPGDPAEWERFHAGVADLERVLAATVSSRDLRLLARTHLSGAFAVGRAFHQAAGWTLTVAGRHGDTSFADARPPEDVDVRVDLGALYGDVTIEADLLGVNVSALAASALAAAPASAPNRIQVRRTASNELMPEAVAGAAAVAAERIRAVVHDRRPRLAHFFCAAPVEFAVLLGHRLTSLHTPVQLYERDGDRYVPSLIIDT